MLGKLADLQALPRFSDGWTFLYVEHARIGRDQHAVLLADKEGVVPVPCAALGVLLLGPGTAISHAAIVALADNGCSVVWCGDGAARFYAAGLGDTRRGGNLERQAAAWASPEEHARVVRRLYELRFPDRLEPGLTLEQIRGHEGVRVRDAYARLGKETGIVWKGRNYKCGDWGAADHVNRALSCANACLYGLCHAAIVSTGFTPALGFIHTGKLLSFVYDVADLYKVTSTVPVAFRVAAAGDADVERRVRRACREAFFSERLVERMVPDIQRALSLAPTPVRFHAVQGEAKPLEDADTGAADDTLLLWDPARGTVAGGHNYASDPGWVDDPEESA